MNNSITISVEFDYKGVHFSPSLKLDLEKETIKTESMDYLYALLARHNKIDLYSYEYEIMQASPIIFSEPNGIIEAYVKDGKLDFDGFTMARERADIIENIQVLLDTNPDLKMLNDRLEETPELIDLFINIYRLGQDKVIGNTTL